MNLWVCEDRPNLFMPSGAYALSFGAIQFAPDRLKVSATFQISLDDLLDFCRSIRTSRMFIANHANRLARVLASCSIAEIVLSTHKSPFRTRDAHVGLPDEQ